VMGTLKRAACAVEATATFARLLVLPAKRNRLPASVRMAPAW